MIPAILRLIGTAIVVAISIPLTILFAVVTWIGLFALVLVFMLATAVVYGLAWPFARGKRAQKPSAMILPFTGFRRRAP